MKECQNLQEFLQAFFPENAELEGFRKRLAADATPDREGLTEALREPDAGEQIRLFEGGDAAGLAAARSRAYSAAFYDACFPEADSAGQALDITANPLVALYFACAAESDCDGKVIVFCVEAADVAYASSDRKLRKHVLKELRIPAGCKAAIVQQLERVNIHQASLFPEPDTVAQYLRRK